MAYGKAPAEEIRECAEVSFVPGEKPEPKSPQGPCRERVNPIGWPIGSPQFQ